MCKFIFLEKKDNLMDTHLKVFIYLPIKGFSLFQKPRVRLITSDGLKKVKYKSKHTVNELKTHLCIHSLPN